MSNSPDIHAPLVGKNHTNSHCKMIDAATELILNQINSIEDNINRMQNIAKITSSITKIPRVGVWLFDDDEVTLRCQALFDSRREHCKLLPVINMSDYHHLSRELYTNGRICVSDAQTDDRTIGIADKYFKPLGIFSILCQSIFWNAKLIGLISFEDVVQKRIWDSCDESLIRLTAAIVSQIIENDQNRRDNNKYRNLFESAPVGIFQTTADGRIISVNLEYAKIFGYDSQEEMISSVTNIAEQLYVNQEDRNRYKELLERDGTVNNFEAILNRRNGDQFWVSMNTKLERRPDGNIIYIGFLIDITERKKIEIQQKQLESQLRHAMKMEAVGTLAGGVAHDFNNILQAIAGYSQFLLAGKPENHPDAKALRHIDNGCARARGLIRQMLTFSRKMDGLQRPMDLNREILETKSFFYQILPRSVSVELFPGSNLWTVYADPVQIQQILLNLGSNAADAMPDGGRLIIETSNVIIDSPQAKELFEIRPGRYVLLTVTDTGCGMSQDVQVKAFDPFFTTKDPGKGTGLGLASVYGIVKGLEGYILCYSSPGQGTSFKIYLPANDEDSEQVTTKSINLPLRGGTETVLVVDDEEAIRDLAQDALTEFGYQVLVAASGHDALNIFTAVGQEIDIVLLDLNMPGMSGRQCLDSLISLDPKVKVVISSGYTEHGQTQEIMATGAKAFIGKPYTIKDLIINIRAVLDN